MLKTLVMTSCIVAQPLSAATSCLSDAMIVFDGSGSMSEISLEFPEPRIVDARAAVARALPQIDQFRRIGLLIYGPGARDGCSNIDLRFGPIADAAPLIIDEVDQLAPGGMTPIAASVEAAANELNYRTEPATIVLVTDGNETCGGTPCQLGAKLKASAQDLTVHVIGFKVRFDFFGWDNPEQKTLGRDSVAKCLSDQTGGKFVSTETVDELVAALTDTLGCALIGATPQRKTAS